MLTLTRKAGEKIRIGDDIEIVIREIRGRQVRIGISAPSDLAVLREELCEATIELEPESSSDPEDPEPSESLTPDPTTDCE